MNTQSGLVIEVEHKIHVHHGLRFAGMLFVGLLDAGGPRISQYGNQGKAPIRVRNRTEPRDRIVVKAPSGEVVHESIWLRDSARFNSEYARCVSIGESMPRGAALEALKKSAI